MIDDLLFSLGAALMTIGIWMAWPPLALVFLGFCVMAAGVAKAKADELDRPPPPAEDDD